MNAIDRKFKELEKKKEGAFIAYITAGDPNFESSLEIADSVIKGGVDILELGLPFSDPIADGPTIQKASQRSLDSGMNTDKYFKYASKIKEKHDIPLVCMTYYNLVLHRGLEKFTRDCKGKIDGLIIPDLPVEESSPLMKACRKNNISLIMLVAPTTTPERLRKISKASTGFIYAVSLRGITGARSKLSSDVKPLVKKIRKISSKPVAVGFGVSTPNQVREVMKAGSQGVIVGSAIIKKIQNNLKNKNLAHVLEKYVREMKTATE